MPAASFPLTLSTGDFTAAAKDRASSRGTSRFTARWSNAAMSRSARPCFWKPISAYHEPRDPRAALIRRQTQIEFLDDALPAHWWQNLALGDFQLMTARLLFKADGTAGRSARRHGTWAGSAARTAARGSA